MQYCVHVDLQKDTLDTTILCADKQDDERKFCLGPKVDWREQQVLL